MSAAKTVRDFKQLVQQQTDELVAKCHHWQEILSEKASEIGNNEDVKGQILTTIGQARLLIKERFGQFFGLIDDCEQQRGEKKTTTDDLAGFWDIISMQIDDVNKKFGLLETAQKNKWRLPETTTMGGNRPHMTTTTTGSASKSRESGGTQNGNGEQQNAVSFESTDRVKEEAEKSATVRERKNELRNFIAQQKKEKDNIGCSRRRFWLLAAAFVAVCLCTVEAGPIVQMSPNANDNAIASFELKKNIPIHQRIERMFEEPLKARTFLGPVESPDRNSGCEVVHNATYAVHAGDNYESRAPTAMNCTVRVLSRYVLQDMATCNDQMSICYAPYESISCESYDTYGRQHHFPNRDLYVLISRTQDAQHDIRVVVDCKADNKTLAHNSIVEEGLEFLKFSFFCQNGRSQVRGFGCSALGTYDPKLEMCVANPTNLSAIYVAWKNIFDVDLRFINGVKNRARVALLGQKV